MAGIKLSQTAIQSLTVLPSGPYVPNLPGAPTIPTPPGALTGKMLDYGGRGFHAGAFNAKADGVTDDTAAIAAAITAATPPLGGEVFLEAGLYKITSALTIPSTVWLVGEKAPMGMIFGDTLSGSVLQPTTGAYNCIQTPSATQNRGGGVMDIGIDGFTDTTHWLIRVFGATGFTLTNVAVRQAATGANGILIGGGAGSALQCTLTNISINCGGGFVGAVGLQWGITGTEIANANTGLAVEVQGYNINCNYDNGGNQMYNLWAQFPAATGVGVRFNSSIGAVHGGWFESLATGIVFTVNTTNCLVIGARKSGAVTTLYTDAGTGNRIIALDNNDYGNVTQTGNLTQNGTIAAGGITSNQGTPGLSFSDRSGPQLWQWYGTASIARLYDGSADRLQVDALGNVIMLGALRRSRQTPTETVLVSGVNALLGEVVSVTLTAARVVGAPLNPGIGQNLTFSLTQGGAGGFAVTWNAVFKKTWADTGNTTGKISAISFFYDGTNWIQTGAQAAYV